MQEPRAGVLRPSFCLVRDDQLQMIVLAIRGTHSLKVHSQRLCLVALFRTASKLGWVTDIVTCTL